MRLGLGLGTGFSNPGHSGGKTPVTEYLFVDGNCLRMHLRNFSDRYADGAELGVNWKQLKGRYEKVFYYDAIPVQLEGETKDEYDARIARISDLHAAISEIDGYRVYEGDARKRPSKGGLEQKKVDVMIAVDMLTHTIRRNMTGTGLLAGDLDFKPLLDALVNEGMFVTLIYPTRFTSTELRRSADAREPMTARKTYGWLDKESQNRIGRIPHEVTANPPQVQNCRKIMDAGEGSMPLSVWQELPEDTITVIWRKDSSDSFTHLRGANWTNTRKFMLDDYGIELPAELPEEFAHL